MSEDRRLLDVAPDAPRPWGVTTHYTCAKGNDHWLSHVEDWDGEQHYFDDCRVHIEVIGGHVVHLTVLADQRLKEAERT